MAVQAVIKKVLIRALKSQCQGSVEQGNDAKIAQPAHGGGGGGVLSAVC